MPLREGMLIGVQGVREQVRPTTPLTRLVLLGRHPPGHRERCPLMEAEHITRVLRLWVPPWGAVVGQMLFTSMAAGLATVLDGFRLLPAHCNRTMWSPMCIDSLGPSERCRI